MQRLRIERGGRWAGLLLLATLNWSGAACVQVDGAPCTADDDCLAEGEVCLDGRCASAPCDEGAREPCAFGMGGACLGVRECQGGLFGICQAQPELCDGRDDDCDGRTDEGFGNLGERCEAGTGRCLAAGVMVCAAEGDSTLCDARPGVGGSEICDGVDDDCDGVTDEQTGGDACRTDLLGACAPGTTVCADGAARCTPDAKPTDETCDGVDNDCDSRTDEGAADGALTMTCYEGPEGTEGVGPCTAGVRTCIVGAFGACTEQVLPADEICDLTDNDCDGVVDEGDIDCACPLGAVRDCYPGPDGTRNIGPCVAGTQACNQDGSAWGPCRDAIVPDAEICDGVDDDCDGVVDNAPGVGDACEAGIGSCASPGARVCDTDSGSVVCDAEPGLPTIEICNGLDDDCNGVDDDVDGLGDDCQVGEGACARDGALGCTPGGDLTCNAEAGEPGVEVCNGVDDDCNGVDDDVPGVGDPCEAFAGACRAVGTRVCGDGGLICDAAPRQPIGEICNGRDDDCDGITDEVDSVAEVCELIEGPCRTIGARICGDGGLICNARQPVAVAEVCNGLDDDCDGRIDETCVGRCGDGRRGPTENCDDGNTTPGDGCSDVCRVEAGFVCLDGPDDTLITIQGLDDCPFWRPIVVPAWSGGYGVGYERGAMTFAGDAPRFVAGYSIRTVGWIGQHSQAIGGNGNVGFHEAPTVEEAEALAEGHFVVLDPGDYSVGFADPSCDDNGGSVDVTFRTLDDCQRRCASDDDCHVIGHRCQQGACVAPAPMCGDGELTGDEGCDDGNRRPGDGCSAECVVEPGFECGPLDLRDGVSDHLDGFALNPPDWFLSGGGRVATEVSGNTGSHYSTALPIGPDYVTRFQIIVDSPVDDDIIGWTIGGGPSALNAPAAPYLLFSWKSLSQNAGEAGMAIRGLRVGRVTGPVPFDTVWPFEGDTLEELAIGRSLGARRWDNQRAYTVELVGDSERLRVHVDGRLEFDLADPPLGDGKLGLYVVSQRGYRVRLLAPETVSSCRPL